MIVGARYANPVLGSVRFERLPSGA